MLLLQPDNAVIPWPITTKYVKGVHLKLDKPYGLLQDSSVNYNFIKKTKYTMVYVKSKPKGIRSIQMRIRL